MSGEEEEESRAAIGNMRLNVGWDSKSRLLQIVDMMCSHNRVAMRGKPAQDSNLHV